MVTTVSINFGVYRHLVTLFELGHATLNVVGCPARFTATRKKEGDRGLEAIFIYHAVVALKT